MSLPRSPSSNTAQIQTLLLRLLLGRNSKLLAAYMAPKALTSHTIRALAL
jgi:hypothetical protein